MTVNNYWKEINIASEKVQILINSYWKEHSDWGNWEFWFTLFSLVFPLFILWIKLDRKRIFEILFYGYSVHVLWTYSDIALIRGGFIDHHYFITPFIPQALGITSSLLPVGFMLVYQYCTNKNKSFILGMAILSAIYAFGFAAVEQYLNFISLYKGFTVVHIFFIDIAIASIAYGMTRFFLKVNIDR
jgi:hypothetical protein